MPTRALITGITGQDGAYLARLLLEKGYEVYGMVRRNSTESAERIEDIRDRVELCEADLLDELSILRLVDEIRPAEIYNLAAQSFVPTSFAKPVLTGEFTALGVARILEAVRHVDRSIRFYQASSSEIFGNAVEEPQHEQTPLRPRNPYGVAKAYGHWITINYRESYGIFAVSGILFNHESPLRGKEFVSRKISDGVARIKLGLQQRLQLGNLDAERDWGFAGDYVEAMWRMLQQPEPHDFVIGTGLKHSVRDFARLAFAHVGLDWQEHVDSDAKLLRPADVNTLRADPRKAKSMLGWQPGVSFEQLVSMMVDADLKRVGHEMKTSGRLRDESG